jgi:hypothetical protein
MHMYTLTALLSFTISNKIKIPEQIFLLANKFH